MTNKINTSGKRFNEIKHLVKVIPATKTYSGVSYRRFTSSFSKVTQNTEASKMKRAGVKVRMFTCRRAGRNVYTLYVK